MHIPIMYNDQGGESASLIVHSRGLKMLKQPETCLPIAVVEAKAEDLEPGAGLQQAKA